MQIRRLALALWTASYAPRGQARPAGPPPLREGASIINGRIAAAGEFPYTTSLQRFGESFCGGSLIARDVVLSAAHCRLAGEVVAVVGRRNLNARDGQVVETLAQVPHPEYEADTGERRGWHSSGLSGHMTAVVAVQLCLRSQTAVVLPDPALPLVSSAVDNDFMLVYLKEPVDTRQVDIDIITPNSDPNEPAVGATVMSAG